MGWCPHGRLSHLEGLGGSNVGAPWRGEGETRAGSASDEGDAEG